MSETKKGNLEPFIIRLDPELKHRLELATVREDRNRAQIIRRAIRQYLDKSEEEA